MSAGADIANATVTLLNAGTYSPSFTAVKKDYPAYAVDQQNGLTVDVFEGPVTRTRVTRGGAWIRSYQTSIIVRKNLASDANSELTPLKALADSICLALEAAKTLASVYVVAEIEQEQQYDPDQVSESAIFETIITFRCRGIS